MCREGAWAEQTVKVTYMGIGFEAARTVKVLRYTGCTEKGRKYEKNEQEKEEHYLIFGNGYGSGVHGWMWRQEG